MSPRNKQLSDEMRAHSRANLLKSARTLFAEKGYFNSKVSEIARSAEMSQGNVYWYFTSKEELLKEILADGFKKLGNTLQEIASNSDSFTEKLDSLLTKLLFFAREYSEFNTIMLSLFGHGGSALLLELGFDMTQIGMDYTRSLGQIVIEGKTEGVIDADVDPLNPTMLFFGLFNGLNLTYGTEWLDLPHEQLKKAFTQLLGVHSI